MGRLLARCIPIPGIERQVRTGVLPARLHADKRTLSRQDAGLEEDEGRMAEIQASGRGCAPVVLRASRARYPRAGTNPNEVRERNLYAQRERGARLRSHREKP